MSRRSYSKHIPDFRLVTHFAEAGQSLLHRVNPWTKMALLGLVVAFVIVLMDLYLIAILYVATIAFYALGRLPLRLLVGWYSMPVLFVVTISVLFMFTEPGRELASTYLLGQRVAITDNGVLLLVKLLLRALAVVTFSLAVFMTTKYSHLSQIASRVLPQSLANVFLLSYRFTFETTDEMSDVIDAIHARNGNLVRGASRQTRLFAGIFGLAFVHAFERAERIAKAMEARGFTGSFPTGETLSRPGVGGYIVVALTSLALAAVAYSRYVEELFAWW